MIDLALVLFGIAVGIPFGGFLCTDGHGHSRNWAKVNGGNK